MQIKSSAYMLATMLSAMMLVQCESIVEGQDAPVSIAQELGNFKVDSQPIQQEEDYYVEDDDYGEEELDMIEEGMQQEASIIQQPDVSAMGAPPFPSVPSSPPSSSTATLHNKPVFVPMTLAPESITKSSRSEPTPVQSPHVGRRRKHPPHQTSASTQLGVPVYALAIMFATGSFFFFLK